MEKVRKLIPQKILNKLFSCHVLLKKTVFTVEIIEARLNGINLERVQKKGENCHIMNMTKIEQFNTRK